MKTESAREQPAGSAFATLIDCSGELAKDAVHSAVVAPLDSILQIAAKPTLDIFTPDDKATGLKAKARQIGEMAGTIFDFALLRHNQKTTEYGIRYILKSIRTILNATV
jgi:hypothetical protein